MKTQLNEIKRMQQLAGLINENQIKEIEEQKISSITARSPLAIEILKKAFKEESPKTKYKVKGGHFEFDLQSFLNNYQDVGIDEESATKIFFMPIAKTIQILDRLPSINDVIFLNN
jgi:hypothetical protein